MPRKKVVKNAARKKRSSKQISKAANNSVSLLQKIEKDFADAPAKITELLTKEIAALKQKETKLNTTISKIQTQISKIEKSIAAAKQSKTAASKKQVSAAKKVLNDTKKDYALSIASLKETANSLLEAEIRLTRTLDLSKQLKQFEKGWVKKAKSLKDKEKAKAVAAAKAKAAKAKKAAKPKAKPKASALQSVEKIQPPTLTVIEQPDLDPQLEETVYDEAKQAIS